MDLKEIIGEATDYDKKVAIYFRKSPQRLPEKG